MTGLAWIPFLEPVHLGRVWWLLIVPLCFGISLVYRAVKAPSMERFLLGGLGPAPTVGQPWGDPPGASTCNDHAAFASGCDPYLVRMIHGKKAPPIQKDGTLQRVLVGGLGPAPTVGRPARRFHMP